MSGQPVVSLSALSSRRRAVTPRMLADAVTERGQVRMTATQAHAILVDLAGRGIVEASDGWWTLTDQGAELAGELAEAIEGGPA